AGKIVESDYDIDRRLRAVWRALDGSGGDAAAALDAELVTGPFLTKLPTLAAALQVLDETGLLAPAPGKKPVGRVDLTTSEAYRLWHRRYRRESLPGIFRSTTS
ncbi:MAG: hypothetical protein FJ000_05075, partial [Actinobacteria bacterium]|nr:hypothetical protein [Actinomycetota bacterium]